MNPYVLDKEEEQKCTALEVDVCLCTEWDELWSFVEHKSNQRWLWYLLERKSGVIVAYHLGRRTDESLQALVNKVAHLPIAFCHTDEWSGYSRCFPEEYVHIVGKDNTWKIERRNLNLRTHLKRLSRKSICFSKNEIIHDNVIGMYIERYYFKTGQFARAA